MDVKLTKFADIPAFTRDGAWECDYDMVGAINFASKNRNDGIEVDLNPDFQRGHVWSKNQQIAWLEFFLRGGKTSRVIYFNHPNWMGSFEGVMVLVDGKQRLEAMRRFIENEIKVFGSYYKEYTDRIRTHRSIKINVNNLKTRAEVLQWYIDFNTGGVVHSDEEIDKVRELLAKEKK